MLFYPYVKHNRHVFKNSVESKPIKNSKFYQKTKLVDWKHNLTYNESKIRHN